MKHLGKVLQSMLLAGAATICAASSAEAGALSFSRLEISNFQIFKSDGSQYDVSDFDQLQVGNFTKAEASLDGAGAVGSNPMDAPLQCVGDCSGIGQNDFGQQAGPLGQFSRGDARLTGAGISGVPSASSSVTTSTVAEIQLNQASVAASGSNTGTGTRFSFVPDADDTLTFNFDADALLRVMLEQDDEMAFAGLAWSLAILDSSGASVFTFAPNGGGGPCSLNRSISTLDSGDGLVEYACSGSFSATSPLLLAGQSYTLSINHESSARASAEVAQVPEPAAAALLGLGLLGLAAMRRRIG